MGYLSNRTINYLNLHAAFLTLLEQAFGVFAPIYLYVQGFALPEVFIVMMLLNIARIPLRLLAFPIVRKIGLRNALMLGTTGYGLTFPLLAMVKGFDSWLLAYILTSGIFNALYWHCFHTFYSMVGEAEHRGKQLAIAQVLGTAVSAAAPFLGSLYIADNGFHKFFFLALPVLLAMILALKPCENISAAHGSWHDNKKLMFNLGAKIHFFESATVWPLNLAWMFVIYFYINKLVLFGGLLTFSIIFQVLYQLWLGGAVDRGRGRRVANMAGGLRLLQVLAKVFCPLSLFNIPAIGALGAASDVHHNLSMATVMYNTGKKANDPFWYWLFAETAFDLGTVVGMGSIIILLYSGVELRNTILLALPGMIAVWWLTRSYYKPVAKQKYIS